MWCFIKPNIVFVIKEKCVEKNCLFYLVYETQWDVFSKGVLQPCSTTGLFISPSGTSELDCATTKKGRAERNISIGRESLKDFFCTRDLGVLAGSTARG